MLDPGTEATTTVGRMRAIEAAFADDLRAYVAALAAVAPDSGAACVDMASGVAAFTGDGSPLSTVKGVGPTLLADDVDAVESFAQAHGVPWLPIELAPWPTGEPDALLAARGYHVADHEDVVATTSAGSATTSAGSAAVLPPDVWTDLVLRIEAADGGAVDPVLATLLAASSRLDGAGNFALAGPEGWIAVAQSVPYREVIVLGNDATLPTARRRGAQTTLIRERVDAVPAGRLVVAEVAPGSGSERNYLRCGFELAYTRRIYVAG